MGNTSLSSLKLRSEFSRNVFTLTTGTTIAQAIPILVSPVLTRLYSPEDFGILALFLAVTSIVALFSTARYENAILLPREEADAANILCLCFAIIAVVSALTLVLVGALRIPIARLLGEPRIAPWLYLVPLSVALTGTFQSLNYWVNRQRNYRRLALSRISQSVAGTSINIGMGIAGMGTGGLIFGLLGGQSVALGVLGWHVLRHHRHESWQVAVPAMKKVAKQYMDFPRFSLWADLMNLLSNQLTVLLLPRFFGVAVLGLYAMGQRVVALPATIIGNAITDVFKGRASTDYARDGNCLQLYKKTFKHLLLLSVIPFLILIITAPGLFAIAFGESWRMAGTLSQVLSVMYLLKFVVSPLSYTYYLANRQKEDMWLQAYMVVSAVASLAAGYYFLKNAVMSLLLYSVNCSIVYLMYLCRSYTFSKRRI